MSSIENTTTAQSAKIIVGEFPCTQTQIRCWILDQLKPGNPALNVAVRWEIRGTFKTSTIEAALRKVIQRHEILRTSFVERNGEPRQQVVDNVDFRMSVIDIRNVPSDQRQQRILEIGEETASEPFDLSKPCLFRVSLLMVSNDSAFLLITAHQSCFDGYSIRVLGREVGEIAAAIDAGRQPTLPDLPLQYGDFAMWQEEYLASYGFEAERAFWLKQLKDAPYFEIPTDKPRGAVKSNRGNILSLLKGGDFGDRMENAARENKVSLYAYGAAVTSAMLHGLSQNTPVMFGTQVAGREMSELEDMIGVFINNVVMRFDLGADTGFNDHLRNTGRIVTEALNNQNMPFNKLVEVVNPVRDPSRNPLISINFNCQKAFLEDTQYGGFQLISAPSQSPGVIYDLSFIIIGRPSGWRMSIEYNADLFEQETIELFLQLWQDAYELALTAPSTALSGFASLAASAGRLGKSKPAETEQRPLSSVDLGSSTSDPAAATFGQRLKMLSDIWSEILPVESAQPDTDFFYSGGHSLLALRMISKVHEVFGLKPDLELLFRKPVLKDFAEAIFGSPIAASPASSAEARVSAPNPWELTTYKSGTGSLSIYTLNHPFLFYRLAGELRDDISVYNAHLFNAPRMEASQSLALEDFAAQAIEAMKITPDTGPVAIMGLCVNGVLAMEIGRQLHASGVDLRLVAAIDAWAPGYFRSLPKLRQMRWNTERRVKRVGYFTGRLLTGSMGVAAYLKEFNATLALMRMLRLQAAQPSDEEETNSTVTDMLVKAARRYTVKTIGAPVALFRSQANHSRAKKLLFGWKDAVSSDTEVCDLEGWHEDSLTHGGISKLAALVSRRLGGQGLRDDAR
ncbi:condensation protein [Rhizobium sp. TH2]|uniref:condensation domain-containing protein n=1 Tax=Rhizobium sp. TH2 TaxID=2775403 RepID=UPI0021581A34|nr:condensation domain-containing protein [Rhizobium sp. TH2]UVC07735.1 condensation protein [Rhizobium sp. TH2]